MTKDPMIGGYVASVNKWDLIDGLGATEAEARAEVVANCGPWEDADGEMLSDEAINERIEVREATPGLMAKVECDGGDITWSEMRGGDLLCTEREGEMGEAIVRDLYASEHDAIRCDEWEVDRVDSGEGEIVVAYCDEAGRAGHVYEGSGSSGAVTWIDATSMDDALAQITAAANDA